LTSRDIFALKNGIIRLLPITNVITLDQMLKSAPKGNPVSVLNHSKEDI